MDLVSPVTTMYRSPSREWTPSDTTKGRAMRVSTAVLALCAVFFAGPLAFAESTHTTFAAAKALAAQRNLPMLLDFHTQT